MAFGEKSAHFMASKQKKKQKHLDSHKSLLGYASNGLKTSNRALPKEMPWQLPIVSPQGPSFKTWIFVGLYQIHGKHQTKYKCNLNNC
jgi:hypothetical protein